MKTYEIIAQGTKTEVTAERFILEDDGGIQFIIKEELIAYFPEFTYFKKIEPVQEPRDN